jgi:hypothetical protein
VADNAIEGRGAGGEVLGEELTSGKAHLSNWGADAVGKV